MSGGRTQQGGEAPGMEKQSQMARAGACKGLWQPWVKGNQFYFDPISRRNSHTAPSGAGEVSNSESKRGQGEAQRGSSNHPHSSQVGQTPGRPSSAHSCLSSLTGH